MEKLSEPELVKHMLEIHGDITKALDATILILDERHKNEIIEKVNRGEISIHQLKELVDAAHPKNPEQFTWEIICSSSHSQNQESEASPPTGKYCCCCFRGE